MGISNPFRKLYTAPEESIDFSPKTYIHIRNRNQVNILYKKKLSAPERIMDCTQNSFAIRRHNERADMALLALPTGMYSRVRAPILPTFFVHKPLVDPLCDSYL